MPTWRFWWASELLGNTPDKVPDNGLKAEFTWDEAYVGGSSLRIRGTAENEYLHLFKTRFELKNDDVIAISYKLLDGNADVNLILTAEGDESTPLNEENLSVITTATKADNGAWITKTFRLTGANAESLAKTIALAGIHFKNADNLDLCIGEFSIRRGATPVPEAPVVTKTRLLCNNMSGVDGKIIFRMPNDKAAGEPVYNLDVNTSMFKLYAQYQGGDIQFIGVTTSWAGLVYAAKNDVVTSTAVRFGVSAVSVDTDSESPITWGEYMPLPAYETTEGIEIDKKIIKPGEEFTVKYTDPRHPEGTWAIYSSDGHKVMDCTENSVSYTCPGIDAIGIYDVVINEGTAIEKVYRSLVQISADNKGAIPEINSLTVNSTSTGQNAEVEFNVGEKFNIGYTGRPANGQVSQGLRINNNFIGASIDELGLTGGNTSFTIAAWIKLDCPAGSSCGLSIENRADDWPRNNWGFFWMDIAGTNGSSAFGSVLEPGGVESYTFRTATSELKYNFTKSVIRPGMWTHVAFTFDWADSGFKSEFYINGVKQVPVSIDGSSTATGDTYVDVDNKSQLKNDMWFSFGGGRGAQANYNDGTVDEVVVWNGAMTAEEVRRAMSGFDSDCLPTQVISYWDMENKAGTDNVFASVGSKPGVPLINFIIGSNGSGISDHIPSEPLYSAGSPFIKGTSYNVLTTPTWTVRNLATISDAKGNDLAGSADISFSRGGDYTVRLSLDNSYGSHTMNYPVFSITDSQGGITDTPDDNTTNIHTVNGMLFIEFYSEGDYTVSVYDASGRLVGCDMQSIPAGGNMSIRLANTGVYVVRVDKDNRPLRTIKILNR